MGQTEGARKRGSRAGKGKKGAETERTSARPLPWFSVFRSRATTQPLVYGQVSRPVTRQPNNAIRTNRRYVVRSSGEERERGARETNERKHRSKHATSETEREREERLYGDALGTDELYAYDRETEQWGYRESHIRRRFAGYVRDTTTTRPACVPAREGTSN